jgi:signal transduction histidine kinase
VLGRWRADVVVCDLNMPGMDGLEVLSKIAAIDGELPVIIHSDESAIGRILTTVHQGAFDFIPKTGDPGMLLSSVEQAARHRWLIEEHRRLSQELRTLNQDLERRVAERTASLAAAQGQLVQAEKLAAVGQLAAGVAHEINTPIQYVGDSLHFLREVVVGLTDVVHAYQAESASLPPAAVSAIASAEERADLGYLLAHAPAALERCVDGVERVAGIVRAMKEFAHPGDKGRSPVNLNDAARRTLTMIANETKYVADVEVMFAADLPLVLCNQGEIDQVLLNLLVNAAHAVGDQVNRGAPRGRITVRTRCDPAMVTIEIADTGGGIPAAIRERIYEPFFTTKEVGRGSGIGLAIARTIVVEQHGGVLRCDTVEGAGTTFYVELPRDLTA